MHGQERGWLGAPIQAASDHHMTVPLWASENGHRRDLLSVPLEGENWELGLVLVPDVAQRIGTAGEDVLVRLGQARDGSIVLRGLWQEAGHSTVRLRSPGSYWRSSTCFQLMHLSGTGGSY